MLATATHIVLALATLGDVTQIGLFLFMSLCTRFGHLTYVSNDCRYCRRNRVTFTNVNDPLAAVANHNIVKRVSWFKSSLLLRIYNKHKHKH